MRIQQPRRYTALRTALIGYGIAAYGYFVARTALPNEATALGAGGSVSTFLVAGLGLQVLMILARVLIKRAAPDREMAAQMLGVTELIGDGITVLLFALGTLGAIVHAPDQF